MANGRTVTNERVDTLEIAGKTNALPVCGVFERDGDGRITTWRDASDMGRFRSE